MNTLFSLFAALVATITAILGGATVTEPAQRVGNPTRYGDTVPTPIDGDCDTWRPLLEAYELPWDLFRPILWRESRCRLGAHAVDSDDHSHGGLQINILDPAVRDAFEQLGFSHDYLHTEAGAIHAAGNLYRVCGMAPWTTYDCGWPAGAPHRDDWPTP